MWTFICFKSLQSMAWFMSQGDLSVRVRVGSPREGRGILNL